MLNDSKLCIRKEVVWTISNITAGTHSHIQSVIDEGIIVHLLETLDAVVLQQNEQQPEQSQNNNNTNTDNNKQTKITIQTITNKTK
eukprot:UN10967